MEKARNISEIPVSEMQETILNNKDVLYPNDGDDLREEVLNLCKVHYSHLNDEEKKKIEKAYISVDMWMKDMEKAKRQSERTGRINPFEGVSNSTHDRVEGVMDNAQATNESEDQAEPDTAAENNNGGNENGGGDNGNAGNPENENQPVVEPENLNEQPGGDGGGNDGPNANDEPLNEGGRRDRGPFVRRWDYGVGRRMESRWESAAYRPHTSQEVSHIAMTGEAYAHDDLMAAMHSNDENHRDRWNNNWKRMYLRDDIKRLHEAEDNLLEDIRVYKDYLESGRIQGGVQIEHLMQNKLAAAARLKDLQQRLKEAEQGLEEVKQKIQNNRRAIDDDKEAKNLEQLQIALKEENINQDKINDLAEALGRPSPKNFDKDTIIQYRIKVDNEVSSNELLSLRDELVNDKNTLEESLKNANEGITDAEANLADINARIEREEQIDHDIQERVKNGVRIEHIEKVAPSRFLYAIRNREDRENLVQDGIQALLNHKRDIGKEKYDKIQQLEEIDSMPARIAGIANRTWSEVWKITKGTIAPEAWKATKAIASTTKEALGSDVAKDAYKAVGKTSLDTVKTGAKWLTAPIWAPAKFVGGTFGLLKKGIEHTPGFVADTAVGTLNVARVVPNAFVMGARMGTGVLDGAINLVRGSGTSNITEKIKYAPKWIRGNKAVNDNEPKAANDNAAEGEGRQAA